MNKGLFHRSRTFSVAVPPALVIGFVTPGVAFADSGTPAPTPAPTPHRVLTAAEIANMDALLAATPNNSEGVPVFEAGLARSLGASKDAISQYGLAFASAGGNLTSASSLNGPKLTSALSMGILARASKCRGSSGFTGMYWFGPQLAMNSCDTTSFIDAINIAAAGGGVYAALSLIKLLGIPGTIAATVIGAVLALGSAFMSWCQRDSSIAAIYLNGGSPISPPTCWEQ
jgi:hypothetical protein